MGADRRHRVDCAFLVAEGGDPFAVEIEDRGFAGGEGVERSGLSRQPAADHLDGDLDSVLDEARAAGERLDPRRVEHFEPAILLAAGEVGDDRRRRRCRW